jgi:HxlR-like helix-turn-helix
VGPPLWWLPAIGDQQHPQRFEYRLTSKGVDLWPVLVALLKWGDNHAAPCGSPVVLKHTDGGGEVEDRRMCTKCGRALEAGDVHAERGPGAKRGQQPGQPVRAA